MNAPDPNEIRRLLPSVNHVLRTATAAALLPEIGAKHLTELARRANNAVRRELETAAANGAPPPLTRGDLLRRAERILAELRRGEENFGLRRVVNATGVVVHTNLGRAPLSEAARRALVEAAGYCTLEYDRGSGARGRRGAGVERLLTELTGAEAALVVNNCAAAAFLVLTALARGGEAVVSRGELVEIGGDFRIPDVMEQAGAVLREVGTTNRTKISDYEQATNEDTKLYLKVHPSNYRIVGFTAAPDLAELARLARRRGVLLYEDAGSGALSDMSRYGLTDEPVIADSVAAGADIVSFSGDKLLGGAQAGLIVGRAEIVEKIRRHPLFRALRADKLILAALEATLASFRRENAFAEVPVLKMFAQTFEEIEKRAADFVVKFSADSEAHRDWRIEIVAGNSAVGGGSAPTVALPTALLAVERAGMSAAKLEEALRFSEPTVIARIVNDRVTLDLRTVSESEETELLNVLKKI